jgi:parvulin-like peptidyl-prolyl isomerase
MNGKPAGRAFAAVLLIALATPAVAQHAGDAVRVNGVGISNERADRFIAEYLARKGRSEQAIRHPDAYRQVRREALDQLVDEELLWQEAVRLKFTATTEQVEAAVARARADARTPDEFARRLERAGLTEATYPDHARHQASIRNLLERKVWKGLSVSSAEVHDWYVQNPARFRTPEEIHARHILIPADGSTPADVRAHARRDAEQIRAALLGGADFEKLARERSKDAGTAARGGDLGWVAPGIMVPEFDAAAFPLGTGKISPVFETVYGFHVVRVDERRGGEVTPEAKASEEIRTYLLGEKRRKASRAEVEALRGRAKIEFAAPP